ncbi:MAG: NAD(P)H-hydrate epimerase [Chloroflexi bacterium]|nr:NAD(P)H-hydrate epimerase [Chloroflexota bacterium]
MNQPFPTAPPGIPYITTAQMREVDRAMIDDFGITLLQMMENAGRNLADVVIRTVLAGLGGGPRGRRVVVGAGPGGNGGGGLVAARHLHNRGCEVLVVLAAQEDRVSDAVRHQLNILRSSGVSIEPAENVQKNKSFGEADAIIDALLGYSLSGSPRDPAATLIRAMNESGAPVVSNDIPTGIDATTGTVYEPAILATATVTIALPKTGLLSPDARQLTGDLYLGDISVPPELYLAALDLPVPAIFAIGQIVKMPDRA